MTYFVSFYAEDNGDRPDNTVVDFEEIKNEDNLESLESFIAWKSFGDNRMVKIINFKEL